MKYRKYRNNWKKVLSVGLGLTLTLGQAAYAEIIVPPIPVESGAGSSAADNQSNQTNTGGASGNVSGGTGPGASGTTGITGPAATNTTGSATGTTAQDTVQKPAVSALVVLERCNLNDVVTFSATATSNLESGAVSLNISEGDKLTVEQCLYGLLLKSANEIGNGLAEHVAGSVSAFADLMNAKARELGCRNTNFKNPHGLNDTEHKTTPYDMALIMRAALQNDTFRKIDSTISYKFPATKKAEERTITMGHKMMYSSDSRYYAGIIGGKTGYTSKAGNTLVTGVEKDGVRLVAVVMKSKNTHYADTKAMLDYGFANYAALTGGSTANGSGTGGNSVEGPAEQQPAPAVKQGWVEDAAGWNYYKQNGSRAANEWQTVDGLYYWFDTNGYMATGWRNFADGTWYYFKPSVGYMMKNTWVEDGGDWYYLGADGMLLTNTTTPDGYPVNEYGIWVQ